MEGLSPLIQVAALCQMLLEALERVGDHGVASEPLVEELRGLLRRTHEELRRRSGAAAEP